MRVEGVHDFVLAMRQLQRVAPGALNDELAEIAEQVILPKAHSLTPVGDGRSGEPGRLQAGTEVVKRPMNGPVFVNKLPYANTRFWGRKQLQGFPNVVEGARSVTRAIHEEQPAVVEAMTKSLDKLIAEHGGS